MTGDGSYTYTYDAENRITSANGVSYTYDGNGLRVKKSSGTLYWRSITGNVLAETDSSGNTQNEYVFFAGRRIAQRTSSGTVYFYYADTLGTVHTITNGTGQACYDATFTPYGQEMLNPNIPHTCSSNYKFTGYEYDSETGLYYANGRYYNPRLGRSMDADASSSDPRNPQSWNGYAYAVNDVEDVTGPTAAGSVVSSGGMGMLRSVASQPLGNTSVTVGNARAEAQAFLKAYVPKTPPVNPFASATVTECQQLGGCPSGPTANSTVHYGSGTINGISVSAKVTEYDSYTYVQNNETSQLASGGGFFSTSWDANVELAYYQWLIQSPSPVMQPSWVGLLSNPLQAQNDNPVDPFFPGVDSSLFFVGGGQGGAGGGGWPQCGIGGMDPDCSL